MRVEKSHSAAGESVTLETQGQAGSARFQQRPLRRPSGLAGRLVCSVPVRALPLPLNLGNPLSGDWGGQRGGMSDKTQRIWHTPPLRVASAADPPHAER